MLEVIAYPSTAAGKLSWRLGALQRFLLNRCIVVFASSPVLAQTAAVRGQVVDQSGAVVPKATVTLTARSGLVRTTADRRKWLLCLWSLMPGQYTVRAAAPKLEQGPVQIVLKPGTQTLRLELKVAALQQQTTVQGSVISLAAQVDQHFRRTPQVSSPIPVVDEISENCGRIEVRRYLLTEARKHFSAHFPADPGSLPWNYAELRLRE